MKMIESLPLPTFAMAIKPLGGEQQFNLLVKSLPEGMRIVVLRKDATAEQAAVELSLFWSQRVEGLGYTDSNEAADILKAEVRRANGVWLCAEGLNSGVGMEPMNLQWIAGPEFRHVTNFVMISEPALFCAQTVKYRKLSGDRERSDEMATWLTLADKSSRVSAGLRALSATPLDWFALWKVFELAKVIVSDTLSAVPLWGGERPFVTEEECWQFRVSANDPIVGGDGVRHAVEEEDKRKDHEKRLRALTNPMPLWDARAWILKLWRRVMHAVSQDPAEYFLDPPPAPVKRVYAAGGTGTLLVMKKDDELDKLWEDGEGYVHKMLEHPD